MNRIEPIGPRRRVPGVSPVRDAVPPPGKRERDGHRPPPRRPDERAEEPDDEAPGGHVDVRA